MSEFRFFASNSELKEIRNPDIEFLSINKALKRQINVNECLLDNESIDRDKPGVVLFCKSEEDLYELEIFNLNAESFLRKYSSKKYLAEITGTLKVEEIIILKSYIKDHLQEADEIEFWQIWEPISEKPQIIETALLNGNLEVVDEALEMFSYSKPICVAIRR